ncbi:uncharacterized protein [Onthophagus taurus]|uniref:uncharacterized protein n=1 Tax=Onthophagus taurus TaxID=166361 RepID=UPI000C20BDE9|nr:zinc finger protein 878-like [Onthophagus taurus]
MAICRFCLKSSENTQFKSLLLYSTYIELILPEIDLSLTETPQICPACLSNLETAYNFKTSCLQSEEKLKTVKNTQIKHEIEIGAETNTTDTFETNFDSKNFIIKDEIDIGEYEIVSSENFCSLYQCNLCGNQFNNDTALNSHKSNHFDAKKRKCEFCGKGFNHTGHFKTHLKTHDKNGNLKPFQCEQCGNRFLKIPYLRRHKRMSCRGVNKSV